MIRISVWHRNFSDSYLRQITQLGANCIDFGAGDAFPGVKEQGYPDLDELLKIVRKIRSWGLAINRVTLPNITERFINDLPGGEVELENACNALKVFAEAGFQWRGAGCSMCLAMNPDKLQGRELSASSSNRNFIGRQGSPTGRTLLMSPAMVAAAAIVGEVVDVRKL